MLSIVVTCKGRLSHLQRTLPSILEQRTSLPYRVVVVDYGDPQACGAWIASQGNPMLSVIRCRTQTREFNVSRARNLGARNSWGEYVAFLDADVQVAGNWLEAAVRPLREGAVMSIPDWDQPGYSACMVSRKAFQLARGFDESFSGWGYEEVDFLSRVSRLGRIGKFPAEYLQVIDSSHLRTRYFKNKDFRATNRANHLRAIMRNMPVNRNGYGRR
ncbi:MAG: glycosyltransferase family 2 protein [bacterium]|nr:glycosyltransferase family 2 protein [bacterium]